MSGNIQFGYHASTTFDNLMENKLRAMKAPWPLSSWEELKGFMRDNGILLSGSFPLGVITQSDYIAGDINFFLARGGHRKIIMPEGWDIYDDKKKYHGPMARNKYINNNFIISIHNNNYDNSYCEFNLLTLKFYDKWEMSSDATEADLFAKKMKFNIKNTTQLINFYNIPETIAKYQQRGFNITNLEELKQTLLTINSAQFNNSMANYFQPPFLKSLFTYPQPGWLKVFINHEPVWPFYTEQKQIRDPDVFLKYFKDTLKNTDRQYLLEVYTEDVINKFMCADFKETPGFKVFRLQEIDRIISSDGMHTLPTETEIILKWNKLSENDKNIFEENDNKNDRKVEGEGITSINSILNNPDNYIQTKSEPPTTSFSPCCLDQDLPNLANVPVISSSPITQPELKQKESKLAPASPQDENWSASVMALRTNKIIKQQKYPKLLTNIKSLIEDAVTAGLNCVTCPYFLDDYIVKILEDKGYTIYKKKCICW